MNFDLPWDIQTLRDVVRSFVADKLIPIETEVDEDRPLPAEVLRGLQDQIKELGLWLLDVPEDLGGPGLGFLARCVIEEEIAKTRALPFHTSELFGPVVDPILRHAAGDQKQRFLEAVAKGELKACFALSEPGGSNPAHVAAEAVRDDAHYVLTGQKRFVTGAATADFAEVICKTEGGVSCLLVDLKSPGVTLLDPWEMITGEKLGEIDFRGVRVPVENRIGAEGHGPALVEEWLTISRLKAQAARAVGFSQRAIDMAALYSTERKTFGQTLSKRGAVQRMIAESATEIEAARLLVYQAAWLIDEGRDSGQASRMAKIFATEMSNRVVDRAIQILGGTGLMRDLPLEYWYRQARSIRLADGAPEALRSEIGVSVIEAVS